VLNIDRACQTCHKWPEAELRARVETIQDRTFEMRNTAIDAVVKLTNDIAAAVNRTRFWERYAVRSCQAEDEDWAGSPA
jgi:nitrite reductase (cytochrome c-552)